MHNFFLKYEQVAKKAIFNRVYSRIAAGSLFGQNIHFIHNLDRLLEKASIVNEVPALA